MTHKWMEKLEEVLDEKLETFLGANPYQELLLKKEFKTNRSLSLHKRREHLQKKAQSHREKLLSLAKLVKEWRDRSNRAKAAGETQLASKADQYVKSLMKKGKALWSELVDIGELFQEIEKEIFELSEVSNPEQDLEEDWKVFQIEEELNQLKRNNSFKN